MSHTLLNNLPAGSDPIVVSLDGPVGAGDGPGGVLTIDAETLVVVSGAGSQSLSCNRGSSPAAHLVGASVDYAAPTLSSDIAAALAGAASPSADNVFATIADLP